MSTVSFIYVAYLPLLTHRIVEHFDGWKIVSCCHIFFRIRPIDCVNVRSITAWGPYPLSRPTESSSQCWPFFFIKLACWFFLSSCVGIIKQNLIRSVVHQYCITATRKINWNYSWWRSWTNFWFWWRIRKIVYKDLAMRRSISYS